MAEFKKDWRTFEYTVPIEGIVVKETTSTRGITKDFIIKGTAINSTVTRNNVQYIADELRKAAESLKDKPILLDHENKTLNIVGRTTNNVFFDEDTQSIQFEGKIMEEKIKEMINDGRIKNVSIGARVADLIESESDNSVVIAQGIDFLELSLTPVPGDGLATINQRLAESYQLKKIEEKVETEEQTDMIKIMNDDMTELNSALKSSDKETVKSVLIKMLKSVSDENSNDKESISSEPLEEIEEVNEIDETLDETDEYIRARMNEPSKYIKMKTKTLSAKDGINVIIGIMKEGLTEVQAYLFSKEKGWTKAKTSEWIKTYK